MFSGYECQSIIKIEINNDGHFVMAQVTTHKHIYFKRFFCSLHFSLNLIATIFSLHFWASFAFHFCWLLKYTFMNHYYYHYTLSLYSLKVYKEKVFWAFAEARDQRLTCNYYHYYHVKSWLLNKILFPFVSAFISHTESWLMALVGKVSMRQERSLKVFLIFLLTCHESSGPFWMNLVNINYEKLSNI